MSEELVQSNNPPKLKLCIDCYWIATSLEGWQKYKCLAPQNVVGNNLIDGSAIYKAKTCEEARHLALENRCTPSAIWFKQKEYIPVKEQTSSKAGGKPQITVDMI